MVTIIHARLEDRGEREESPRPETPKVDDIEPPTTPGI